MSIQPLETGLTGAGKLKNAATLTTVFLFLKVFHTLILVQDDTGSSSYRMLGRQFSTRLGPAFMKIPLPRIHFASGAKARMSGGLNPAKFCP